MKRIFVSLVLILALAFTTVSLAEGIDLTSLSDEELLLLNEQMNAELASRALVGVTLRDGDYVVGDDIAPGKYDVYFLRANEGEDSVYFSIQEIAYANLLDAEFLEPGESMHIKLEDGQYMSVSYGSIILLPSNLSVAN